MQNFQHCQWQRRLLSRLSRCSSLCRQQCQRALTPPAHLHRGLQQNSSSLTNNNQSWPNARPQLCHVMRQELELAVVQEQAALAAEGRPREVASPLRGVRPAALVHVEALRQQAEAASAEARLYI